MIFDTDPGMHPANPPASTSVPYMPTWGPDLPIGGPFGNAGHLSAFYNASDESAYHLAGLLADLRPELVRDSAPTPGAGQFAEPAVWYFRFGTKLVNVGVLLTPYLSSPGDPIGAIRALLASGNIPPKKV